MSVANELVKLYKKNLSFFQKYHPDLFTKLNTTQENTQYDLIIEDDGYFNIEHIKTTQKVYNSNSEHIAQIQVNELMKSTEKIDKIVFTGTLLGLQIEKLILAANPKCILIIEPNIEFFKFSAFLIDYEILTKDRFILFSIQENEENLENKFLEFIFTMFYYNKNTSYLNSTPSYKPIIDLLTNIVNNNVAHELIHLPNYIPTLRDINITEVLHKAQLKEKQNNFKKSITLYLDILECECKHGLNQKAKKHILLAYLSLGNIFYSKGNIEEAFHCYGKCVSTQEIEQYILEPALHNFAMINKNARHNYKKMVKLLSNYLNTNPKNIQLAILLSEYLFQLNKYEVAQTLLDSYKDELIENKRVEGLLPSIPIVYQSQIEIDTFRAKLENTLDILLTQQISIPENNLTLINAFYLAYHNRTNTSILEKLSNFYTQVTPSLTYEANHCSEYQYNNKKIKIGFISNYLVDGHPVMKFMENILKDFAVLDKYEVHLFTFSNKTPKMHSIKRHLITTNIKETRENIASYKLDIIIYPEIWMHAPTYFLAYARLAPIQCMFSGHPMTSGIDNIDYYFSQKDIEVSNAQKYYTEKLILLNNFVASYNKPYTQPKYLSKNRLGLYDNKNNYLIPAKLQKIHPDFDDILLEITQKDKDANLIFFKDSSETNWDEFVQDRLLKKILMKNLTFLPWANSETFTSLLHHADAILEPTIFGYGTTAIEAFSIGTPIVTLPGHYNSGRAVSFFYKLMNFTELIASNKSDYVTKAIRLAKDISFQKSCKNKILESNSVLFNTSEITEELNIFFQKSLTK